MRRALSGEFGDLFVSGGEDIRNILRSFLINTYYFVLCIYAPSDKLR